MNRKIKSILGSVLVIAIAASMMTVGTHSYFSDTETSSANTFTAGTLDLQLSNDGSSYSDGVTATWQTPSNWAPGDEECMELQMTNVGTINVPQMEFDFRNLQHNGQGDASNLMNAIIVTELKERFNGIYTENQADDLAAVLGDNTMPLTMAELVSAPMYATNDKTSGDEIVLGAGNQEDYGLKFCFKFAEDSGNIYQGDTCGFDLWINALQYKKWNIDCFRPAVE